MINKLQFIHQNTVFSNREAAKTYLKELIVNTRPSLYAEPLVVKYESGDDAKGPNLLLAVGSVGDGKYDGDYNRTQQRLFFIDMAYCEEEIEAIWDRIEEIVGLLTIIPLESDTMSLHTQVASGLTEISGDVKVADAQVIEGVSRPNQINVVPSEGLFHFVDVSYSNSGVLTFQVNDEIKNMNIPVLTGGTYHYDDEDAENLVLSLSNGESIKVNLRKLIDEWTVLPVNAVTTPIVLKREKINPEDLPYGVSEWQDVLTADIRLHEGDGNILYKNDGGRTLYAKVNLDYNELENKLVFTWSENGQVNTKDIALNSVKLIEYIRYDASTEEIVIGYKTSASSETIVVRIPVGDLINEWVPVSEAHNVILNRTRNISGADEVTADVRIASKEIVPSNIVETIGENKAIFVRGEADNIKFGSTNVQAELERLGSEEERIETELNGKTGFLSGVCDTINDTIGSGFTDDTHSNITAKFAEISGYTSGVSADLQAEIERAQSAENFLSGSVDFVSGAVDAVSDAVDTVDDKIGSGFTDDPHTNVTAKFEALSAYTSGVNNNLNAEIGRAQAAENALSGSVDFVSGAVDTTNANLANEINRSTTRDEQLKGDIDTVSAATATKISGITGVSGITVDSSNPTNPKISLELNQDSSNILTLNREGLYTTVDLTYNESDNKLIFSTTKGSKEIALNSIKFIEYIDYDDENEEIVIGYKTAASGEVLELRIPVGELITEWVPVSEGHNVILNRTRLIHGSDEVTADVRIASKDVLPLNILETVGDNKSLYVRGEANNIKFGNTNVQAELERLDSEDERIETEFSGKTAFLSGAVDTVDNKIGSGFTDDPHTNVTAKFEALSGYSSGVSADLQAEIDRAQAAENFLSGSVDTVTGRVTALEGHSEDTDELIGNIVEGVGLNPDGTYKPIVTAKYISGATSVNDALEMLNNGLDFTDIICGDYA